MRIFKDYQIKAKVLFDIQITSLNLANATCEWLQEETVNIGIFLVIN